MQVIILILLLRKDSQLKKFDDVKGKVLSLNTIGSTSGDLIPQVELNKINLSIKNKDHFKKFIMLVVMMHVY